MGKISIVLILVIFSLHSCSDYGYRSSSNLQKVLVEQKEVFGKDYLKGDLLSQFPVNLKNDSVRIRSNPPSCPPSYSCSAQFGDITLIVKKSDYQKSLEVFSNNANISKIHYNDSNIVIDLLGLREQRFPVEKCNHWFENKLPIPYFESVDFGLGYKEENMNIDGEMYTNYIHTIPSDLEVYVIQAEAGNFWKKDCGEKRPESLKEWKNGYSKGFSVSEKENIIVYWTMIW